MPSDLEQMPYLPSFASGNRMLLTHDHSQLISHTANACIRSMSDVYPDRLGAGVLLSTFFH